MGVRKTVFGRQKVKIYADNDVNNFILASGVYDIVQTDAVNYLITSLKSNLWAKMKAVYPMVGGSANTHKWNAKNPLDLDSAFRMVFTGGTHNLNGWKGSNAGSRADTFLIPSTVHNVNSNGITVCFGEDGILENVTDVQSGNTATQRIHLNAKSGNLFVIRMNGNQSPTVSNTDVRGVYTGQRLSSTVANGWKNGNKLINQSNASGTLPTPPIQLQNDKRFQSFFIHEGLTDSEVYTLHSIINIYENMLSRKTW